MSLLRNYLAEKSAATAIEYGLIAALIAVSLVAAFTVLSGSISNTFLTLSAQIQ